MNTKPLNTKPLNTKPLNTKPWYTKPWYKSLTVWSLIVLAVGYALAAVADGGVSAVLTDDKLLDTLGQLLQMLGFGGALIGRARAGGPLTTGADGGRRGFVLIDWRLWWPILVGSAAAMLAMGCGHTFTGARGDVLAQPYGDSGVQASCTVEDAEVCRCQIESGALRLPSSMLTRLCAEHPEPCRAGLEVSP